MPKNNTNDKHIKIGLLPPVSININDSASRFNIKLPSESEMPSIKDAIRQKLENILAVKGGRVIGPLTEHGSVAAVTSMMNASFRNISPIQYGEGSTKPVTKNPLIHVSSMAYGGGVAVPNENGLNIPSSMVYVNLTVNNDWWNEQMKDNKLQQHLDPPNPFIVNSVKQKQRSKRYFFTIDGKTFTSKQETYYIYPAAPFVSPSYTKEVKSSDSLNSKLNVAKKIATNKAYRKNGKIYILPKNGWTLIDAPINPNTASPTPNTPPPPPPTSQS